MTPVRTSPENTSPDLLRQQKLVEALCQPRIFIHKTIVAETHISWVLLNGRDAYKIKKSVNLGFLDFSTLELRRYYCEEELRLNHRLTPDLYLEVIAIGGTPEEPVLGKQPAIEYAVHMRRFSQSNMMDHMLSRGLVTPAHIDKLASIIANFHASLPPANADSPNCALAEIEMAAEQNFAPLSQLFSTPEDTELLKVVHAASMQTYSSCEPLFLQRALAGFVRECHGDLHLGNIVVLDDVPTPFDCIEFSPTLRWIDTISEISFTTMDLLRRGKPQLAWRLLNKYLEITGDFSGIGVLRFYLAYRAMVRAKIAAIRAGQRGARIKIDLKSCRSYLRLANNCLSRRRSAMIITYGLPGCGKSSFAQLALERLGAIRIRSDVERKRLFGLTPLANSKLLTNVDIYSVEATRQTYEQLNDLARGIIAAGFTIIIDAAFVLKTERDSFHALANEMSVPFVIASVQADADLLEERLMLRSNQQNDASEADVAVLKKLQVIKEPLSDEELGYSVTFNNNGEITALQYLDEAWETLDNLLV
jgi:aminoglycoside phosphotransferase family enzyme/predicted kinase